MEKEFTQKQLKELRKVNPRLTDGLFADIIKDLNEDYNIYLSYEEDDEAYAFKIAKAAIAEIKVVNASDLVIEASNYPLIKESEAKYREFNRYDIFNDEDDDDYLNEYASLFAEAYTNVYRVYTDEKTKKIAFAFWL